MNRADDQLQKFIEKEMNNTGSFDCTICPEKGKCPNEIIKGSVCGHGWNTYGAQTEK